MDEDLGGGKTQRCHGGINQSEASGPSGLNNLHLIGRWFPVSIQQHVWNSDLTSCFTQLTCVGVSLGPGGGKALCSRSRGSSSDTR